MLGGVGGTYLDAFLGLILHFDNSLAITHFRIVLFLVESVERVLGTRGDWGWLSRGSVCRSLWWARILIHL